MIDKFDWMQEKWGFARAPIPADGIRRPTDPFSRAASSRELTDFGKKFIVGGIRGGLTYGYLWSLPDPKFPTEGTGTGYGKTSLLLETESQINHDFGTSITKEFGIKDRLRIVASYTCLDNQDTRGLFALLFSAVERWADPTKSPGPQGRSVLRAARKMIVDRLGCHDDDAGAIRNAVEEARRALPGGATLPPMCEEVIEPFCENDEDALPSKLADVTSTSRSRNGLSYFETAVSCLLAAGIEHVFFFLDQLEYMVTNGAVTKAKKSQEIARFRSVFTQQPLLVNRCHVVFTLHHRASQQLHEFWELNRLPPFDPQSPSNRNAVVVLRGLESPEKIEDLVLPYFDAVRSPSHPTRGKIAPLDRAVFPMLWKGAAARPGIILTRVATALDLAAEENRNVVDTTLMDRVLGMPMNEPTDSDETDDDASALIG